MTKRPPVIVILGHVDHGKSTLLNYIRQENAIQEAGGITQAIGVYEINYQHEGKLERLTFIDTPGHHSFEEMRTVAASAADLAVLVVSAEEGPKPQTLETLKIIQELNLPLVIALTKIDRPAASVEKTKQQLAEHSVLVEGYGGKTPFAAVSGKTGQGVKDLLDLIILTAELLELQGDPAKNAVGLILETNINPKSGVSATLLIKDGRLWVGDYIAAGNHVHKVKQIFDFQGKPLEIASFSSPVTVTGFNRLPPTNTLFRAFDTKTEALKFIEEQPEKTRLKARPTIFRENAPTLPLIVKAGTNGALAAVVKEIEKRGSEEIWPKIIFNEVGNISESDVKLAISSPDKATIVGFTVDLDPTIKGLAERHGVTVILFNIIYKLTEWLEQELDRRRPKVKVEETVGRARVLKIFRSEQDEHIIGGAVEQGKITIGTPFKLLRRDNEIARGRIKELRQQKIAVKEINQGEQFGALVECKMTLAANDLLLTFEIREK